MKRVAIVTGAHGFIGRHISRTLSKHDWRVLGVGHGNWQSAIEQRFWGIDEWKSSDITSKALAEIGIVPDVIVHCAGSGTVSFSLQNPKEDFDRCVTTTLNVLEFAKQYAPAAHIVTMSSAAVYGEANRLPIIEDDDTNPVSPYGVHKHIAEQLCESYSIHFGLNISILRLFSVYGEGLKKQFLWDACNKLKREENIFHGTGNEIRDWIHINDVASLIEHVLSNSTEKFSIFNGACGVGITISEVLQALQLIMSSQASFSFSGIVRAGDPTGYIADTKKATQLGWNPKVTWEKGISDYGRWYRDTQ